MKVLITLFLILLIVSGCNKSNDNAIFKKESSKENIPFNISINDSQTVDLSINPKDEGIKERPSYN